jgi:hypothetical protein
VTTAAENGLNLGWPNRAKLKVWRRGSESNRRIKVLQTSPLPLGYRAPALANSVPKPSRCIIGARASWKQRNLERETGFEPATSTLARSHSTTELLPLSPSIVKRGWGSRNCPVITLVASVSIACFCYDPRVVLGASHVWSVHSAHREYDRCKQNCGKPDPYKFALNDGEPSWREKT